MLGIIKERLRNATGLYAGLKIRWPVTKSAAIPNASKGSIKGSISVPVSPSSAVECYPCRDVSLNDSDSLLFHGGDTGSTPVPDANS
jgi:hypothetical protein